MARYQHIAVGTEQLYDATDAIFENEFDLCHHRLILISA